MCKKHSVPIAVSMTGKEGNKMKIYITKYAFSKGIIEVDDLEKTPLNRNEPVTYKEEVSQFTETATAGEWHYSKDEAMKTAEEMRIRKINNLKQELKSWRV